MFYFESKYIECKLCLFSGFAAAASTFKAVLAQSSPEKLDLRVQLKKNTFCVLSWTHVITNEGNFQGFV